MSRESTQKTAPSNALSQQTAVSTSTNAKASQPPGFLASLFKPAAAQGIEDAYARTGSNGHHTTGSGLAKDRPQHGVDSQRFQNTISDQRPEPGFISKMWNNWVHGADGPRT
ncbi:MAG: hypothetical protein M1824_000438 [Vezdaea acicularis]|nr:MAG: hypothetical protein M1824_000438 [Vezdaea acicularis]